jgi:iron complex outermembrane receptor protein
MGKTKIALALLAGAASVAPTTAFAQDNEIVVTAQRRAERYVDVPASVSVATAQQLSESGINNSHDLRLLTPGLNVTQQGLYTQPTIRGVGTSVTGPGADPNVAIYVDGVYQPNQGAALFDFANIERVETLKGPQGTLYGRNATGGAVVVTTRAPSLDVQGGRFEASYGSFNESVVSAYYNLPISDTFAMNFALYNRQNDGYTDNVITGEDASVTEAFNARMRVLIQPTDNLRFLFTASHTDSFDSTAFSYTPINNNALGGAATQAAQFGLGDREHIALNTSPSAEVNAWAFSLNAELTGSWGTLTSITSFATVDTPFATDLDGTENNVQSFFVNPQEAETYSQELIYASPQMGAFSWLGGIFYIHDEALSDVQVCIGAACPPAPPLAPYASQETSAAAIFAEGTIDLTPDWHLTIGGRYSVEEKHARNRNATPTGPLLLDAEDEWTAFTPRVALRYDVTDNSSAYISYSEGFKSGLFDAGNTGACTGATLATPACPSPGTPVEPEEVRAYEIGYRYSVGGTTLSLAAFFNEYENIQINALNAANLQVLYNAAAGEIFGAEAEFATNFNANWSLRSGVAYTNSEYTDFPAAQNFVPLVGGGNAQALGNNSGNQMIRSPEWTAYGALTYTHPLPVGTLESTLTAAYSDSYFWHVDNRLEQPAYTMFNANLTWYAPGDRWHVRLFGDNLSDEEVQLYVREATVGDFASYGKPRTWGVAIGAQF